MNVGNQSAGKETRLGIRKVQLMVTVYLVNDAVLTSGLKGESSVVGEPFRRSFDAHELRQEVRQEVRQELSEDS